MTERYEKSPAFWPGVLNGAESRQPLPGRPGPPRKFASAKFRGEKEE